MSNGRIAVTIDNIIFNQRKLSPYHIDPRAPTKKLDAVVYSTILARSADITTIVKMGPFFYDKMNNREYDTTQLLTFRVGKPPFRNLNERSVCNATDVNARYHDMMKDI